MTQIVEDDFGGAPARVGRSASTTNVGGDARPGSSAGAGEGGRLAVSAAALLPALKEVASGLGEKYDLMKELVHAVQARLRVQGIWMHVHLAALAINPCTHGPKAGRCVCALTNNRSASRCEHAACLPLLVCRPACKQCGQLLLRARLTRRVGHNGAVCAVSA